MLWRQIKIAPLSLAIALICAFVAITHHDSDRGSASQGEVRDGHYFLSLGHGGWQETDAATFASLRHNERVVLGSLAVTVLAMIWAGLKMKQLGLPNSKQDVRPPKREITGPTFDQLRAATKPPSKEGVR